MDGFDVDIDMQINVDAVLSEVESKTEKALMAVGLEAEGDAKIEIESDPRRVDTGRLRNSITWATQSNHDEPSGEGEVRAEDRCPNATEPNVVLIGTNVEYAVYVHEGTGRKNGDPNRFLRNAVEKNREKYKNIIDDVMKDKL